VFSPAFRLLLVIACLAGTAVLVRAGSPAGWALLIPAVFLLLGYWRKGSVWLARRAYLAGNLRRMDRRLRWTRAPDHLAAPERAYYEFLKGVSARRKGDLVNAERHLSAAVAGPLLSPGDQASAFVLLAEVTLAAGDFGAARNAVAKASATGPLPQLEQRLDAVQRSLDGQSIPP
jgi:hypothetical protein